MARKDARRYTQPAAPEPQQPQTYGHVERGGTVHQVYVSLTPEERQQIIEVIGLKWCQRIGHRHKIGDLRVLADLSNGWSAVDTWITADEAEGGMRLFGDLFDPLLTSLVERARELLGDDADEPTTDQLSAMADTLATERSLAQARLLLATVVEFQFTAEPQVQELAATQDRFRL